MEGISGEDLRLINKYSERANLAVSKGFSFWSDKPFVVEFDPNEDWARYNWYNYDTTVTTTNNYLN